MLAALGYTVLAAAGPDEARRLATAHTGVIHLLLCDVIMPGLSGPHLARELLLERPALKCLFMSGYPADVIAHRGVLEQDLPFLGKPFTRDSLARTARDLLNG